MNPNKDLISTNSCNIIYNSVALTSLTQDANVKVLSSNYLTVHKPTSPPNFPIDKSVRIRNISQLHHRL